MKRNIFGGLIGILISVIFSTHAFSLALYDDFSGTSRVKEKWKNYEFVREIRDGKLVSKVESYGSNIGNNLNFRNPASVNYIEADVTVNEISTNQPNGLIVASISERLYNDGTGAPQNLIGEVQASVGLGCQGGNLKGLWSVSKSRDGSTWPWVANGSFAIPISLGQSYKVSILWEPEIKKITFTINEESQYAISPETIYPSNSPWASLSTGVWLSDSNASGEISAAFDNVIAKNQSGQVVFSDDFSYPVINGTNWATYENVGEVLNGQFRSKVRSSLGSFSNDANRLGFADPSSIQSIEVKVRPSSFINPSGTNLRSRIRGSYYNDGTPGEGSMGDVSAQVRIGGTGTNPVGMWIVVKNLDKEGNNTEQLASGTFTTPILMGNKYTLLLGWNGSQFTFKIDDEEAVYSPVTRILPPKNPFKFIETQVSNPNGKEATMEVNFDDVMVEKLALCHELPGFKCEVFAVNLGSVEDFTFDNAGGLWVGSGFQGTVTKIDVNENTPLPIDGSTLTPAVTGLDAVFGLAFDGVGNLFIPEFNSGKVAKIDASLLRGPFPINAGLIPPLTSGLGSPDGVAVGPPGGAFGTNIFVGDVSRSGVFEIDPNSGDVIRFRSFGADIEELIISNDGNKMFAISPGGGKVFSLEEPASPRVLATAFAFPDAIAQGPGNKFGTDLYIGDLTGNTLYSVNSTTGEKKIFVNLGSAFQGFEDIIFDAFGRMYILGFGRGGQIIRISPIDTTAPVIVPMISPTPNAEGWNNTDVTVSWTVSDPESVIAFSTGCGVTTLTTETAGTVLTCSAANYAGLTSSSSVTVKIDKTPPAMDCSANLNSLWPANHKLIPITVSVTAVDLLSGGEGFTLSSVTSNEPDNGLGDGDTPNDIQGFIIGTMDTGGLLRAERSGRGTGRIYTLIYRGMDIAGNPASCSATVTVPHDKGK